MPTLETVDLGLDRAVCSMVAVRALERDGAFAVVGHGVDDSVISGVYSAADALHRLDESEKKRVEVGTVLAPRGWYRGSTNQKGTYESFEIGHHTDDIRRGDIRDILHGANVRPRLPGFRTQTQRYCEAMASLGQRLAAIVCFGLGLPDDYLASRTKRPCCLLRLLAYEAAPRVDVVGIKAHTDFELLTILSEDSPGLRICNRSGDWTSVEAGARNRFLVLAGDLLEIISGGRIESALHEVVSGAIRRRSIAFFFGLDADAAIEPQFAVAGARTDLYGPCRAGEHLGRMLVISYPHLRREHDRRALLQPTELPTANPFKAYKLERLDDRCSGR